MFKKINIYFNTNFGENFLKTLSSINFKKSFSPCYLNMKKIDFTDVKRTYFDLKSNTREYSIFPTEKLLDSADYSFVLGEKEVTLEKFETEIVTSEGLSLTHLR